MSSLFLSTLSLRRATACAGNQRRYWAISIHALLAESDLRASARLHILQNFYPRSPCGERHDAARRTLYIFDISIHALLAESDRLQTAEILQIRYFYPRSPCGERLWPFFLSPVCKLFLSTLSLRRATLEHIKTLWRSVFLSTLSLRRATRKSCNEL